jgi:hypothetical protein
MENFLNLHGSAIAGTLSTFDRLIFKGHLMSLQSPGGMFVYLDKAGVPLSGFGRFVDKQSEALKSHAKQVAQQAGRPYVYDQTGQMTRRGGKTKEQWAKELAEQDGIKEGLIGILATIEPCSSFVVRGQSKGPGRTLERRRRKCVHLYYYYMDREFGFMHIRLQTWFPCPVQIYINGREWLACELDKKDIKYARYENSLTWIGNLEEAQQMCIRFEEKRWVSILHAFGRRVNPLLTQISERGFGEYYWVIDQCEYATDVLFKCREDLERVYPDLVSYAALTFGAKDIMGFLGRKLTGNFQGEVIADSRKRLPGWRVKYWMKGNSLKMYDKGSVLRVETTINYPREFKVLEVKKEGDTYRRRWVDMGKGVTNLYRYAEVSLNANKRLLEALANAPMNGKVIEQLDDLCRSHTKEQKRIGKFNPLSQEDSRLFSALLEGHTFLNGARNQDLQQALYPGPAATQQERTRRTGRVSRLLGKLRGHGLLAKVQGRRLYRLTVKGLALLKAIVRFRTITAPATALLAQAA